jgi:hypothetical protein
MVRFLFAFLVTLALLAGVSLAADPLDGILIEPERDPSYDRTRDYGGWATPEPCMSTRMIVLRDESTPSKVRIKRRASGACDVWMGRWKDQYVGYITDLPP